jgi:ATP-dependent Clp protease, protease subunit
MTNGERTVFIKFFAAVNENSINPLMNIVDQSVREGVQRLVLLISSTGGSVFHGLSAYNCLKGLPIEIETHNFGSVDSIGVVLFLAGSKRYSVPDARFLIHPVSWGFESNVRLEDKQIEETLKSLRIDTENIAAVIAASTKKKERDIIKFMHERTTLSPEQAQEFGLVHEIKQQLVPSDAELVSINMA